MSKKVIVVGAGAAGLMAAGTAAKQGCEVLLIERNDKVARKVMITGKGRCNVTNATYVLNELVDFVPVNSRFLYSSFSKFMPVDTMDFFEELGVELKVERGNRVFPVSDKAVDIVDALNKYIRNNNVKRIKGRVKKLIINDEKVQGVRTFDDKEYIADCVIVATGGASYVSTGSSGDGYELAKQVGHTIVELKPSLVPLESSSNVCKQLQGLSLRNVSISVINENNNKVVYTDFGEMLFTHFGVSGPVILSASSHLKDIKSNKYKLIIDLKPALSNEQLDARILRDFEKNINRDFGNSLGKLLPQKIIPVIIKNCGVNPEVKTNQVTKEMRQNLIKAIKEFEVPISNFRPINEAIITSGGVETSEINPKTMESKKISSLYFAGEIIDVDAYTGGFNLQIAFSTGHLAGESVAEV